MLFGYCMFADRTAPSGGDDGSGTACAGCAATHCHHRLTHTGQWNKINIETKRKRKLHLFHPPLCVFSHQSAVAIRFHDD